MKCALTGHRRLPYNFSRETLSAELEELVLKGTDTFYCGMAVGFDMEACMALLKLKKRYPLRVVACVPCPEQDAKFTPVQRQLYHDLLDRCDEVNVISPSYSKDCMRKRNYYMVDRADFVYCYFSGNVRSGTYQTIRYAQGKDRKIFAYGFTEQ